MGESVYGSHFVRLVFVRAILLLAALVVSAGLAVSDANAKPKKPGYEAPAVTSKLDARVGGSIQQIWVQDADPGSTILLVNPTTG